MVASNGGRGTGGGNLGVNVGNVIVKRALYETHKEKTSKLI